ncbi:MAG TPA: M20 family metallopeptidase [Actinomycetota bacterium]|nr:M20 family metallopeptidase [Actinomycetota bacterium]
MTRRYDSGPEREEHALDVRDLQGIVARRYEDFVEALRDMVNVDCGSYTPQGVNAIADRCQARFEAGGWAVERRAHDGEPRLGDLLVGRLSGSGGPRVLMIGHMDTVFDPGTVAERPFRIEGGRALGPGVSDMKGGLLTGFFAVETLQDAGFDGFGQITYICNPDEEIGSPWSRDVIRAEAANADVALVLEGARENGDIVSARKGVSDYTIEIAGRAAHAGVEPERGRSAILEAAHKTVALQALNGRWPGVTVNVGVVHGGTRPNVVAERCLLEVDVRSPVEETFQEAEAAVEAIAGEHTVPDVTVSVRGGGWHRPMEKKEGGARLAELAIGVAADLGFQLRDAATGGASDANTTSAAGVPTLDGLGPIGGDDHSPNEWLELPSVVPRISLLAGLLSRL